MDDDDAHVDGASDATPRSEPATKRRHRWFLPIDPLSSAILARAIQYHETSDEIGVHLSRAKMVPYLIASCRKTRSMRKLAPSRRERAGTTGTAAARALLPRVGSSSSRGRRVVRVERPAHGRFSVMLAR